MNRAAAARLTGCLTATLLMYAGTAHATTWLSTLTTNSATNFAVLDTGGGVAALDITNATVTGFVGIGDPNGNDAYLVASGSKVNGGVEYAASAINGSNSVTASTISWGVTANVAAVQSALTAVSSFSTTLGGETGTSQNITAGAGTQTITATSGTLDASGNYVFTVGTVSLSNGGVLTINGSGLSASQDVVFNISASVALDGSINLVGLSPDQVLFNVTGSSHTLTINGTSTTTVSGDFLDYSGSITVEDATLNGRVFGGDSSTLTIGATGVTTTINGPGVKVPEPSSLALLGAGVVGLAGAWRRRKPRAAA